MFHTLKESQKLIQNIIKDTLPYEFGKSLNCLGRVVKECWNIFEDPSGGWTNKDKLNALKLLKETEITRFEILQNGLGSLEAQQIHEKVNKLIEDNQPEQQKSFLDYHAFQQTMMI